MTAKDFLDCIEPWRDTGFLLEFTDGSSQRIPGPVAVFFSRDRTMVNMSGPWPLDRARIIVEVALCHIWDIKP